MTRGPAAGIRCLVRRRSHASAGSSAVGAPSGHRNDRGSAAVWVLACTSLLMLVATISVLRSTAILARRRAETAADFAALAAAVRIGVATDECAAAGPITAANGAVLVGCELRTSPDGRSGTVAVRVRVDARLPIVGTVSSTATARAARDPPGPPDASTTEMITHEGEQSNRAGLVQWLVAVAALG